MVVAKPAELQRSWGVELVVGIVFGSRTAGRTSQDGIRRNASWARSDSPKFRAQVHACGTAFTSKVDFAPVEVRVFRARGEAAHTVVSRAPGLTEIPK
jgi:hypothetical protein